MKSRRSAGAMTLALAAATLTGVLAFAGSTPKSHEANATAVSGSGLSSRFSVLNEQAVPTGQPDAFASTSGRLLHVDPAAARQIHISGHNLWVAPNAQGDLCLLETLPEGSTGGGCGHPGDVETTGFFTTGHPAPADVKALGLTAATTDIAAVVPDGVTTVEIVLADHTTKTFVVHDNGIAGRLTDEPTAARFDDAGGDAHVIKLGE
jgi:hypothetical protein